MTIKDRFTRGLLAGVAGGIVMAIVDLTLTAFGWVKFPFYDWGLSLIYGSAANTFFEAVLGQVIHIFFAGMLGVLFAYIITLISGKNIFVKGWFFGVFVWFSVHVVVNVFNFEPLKPIPISQLISDFISASIYGLILAKVLQQLDHKKV